MKNKKLQEEINRSIRTLQKFNEQVEKTLRDEGISLTLILDFSTRSFAFKVWLDRPKDQDDALMILKREFPFMRINAGPPSASPIIRCEIILTKEPDPFEEECGEIMRGVK